MPLIGTAGHVDHGKSTLIERITGRDPDRWAEEKERGLTIDLGFGWATLPEGTVVSFVDVPGHERFLKNMLAGIEAIDVALLVVAADEGWMPQSEEHLAVLDLLGVSRGVVAVTKTDIVDEDTAGLAAAEVEEQLIGTSLEGVLVVPVSARTGEGLDVLIEELERLASEIERVETDRPRLWVDRSFVSAGSGTVVTGTLLGGSITSGVTVEIYPTGSGARVRSIQTHEEDVASAEPGRRVALNLAGMDKDDVGRGKMVGLPGQWDLSGRFLAVLSTARYQDDLPRRGAYQIHLGTSAQPVRITAMGDGVAILNIESPLPISVGDRFVIRDTGRRLVVAGGRVLDPTPGSARSAIDAAHHLDPDAAPEAIANSLLALRGSDTLSRLQAHSGGGLPTEGLGVAGVAYSATVAASLSDRLVALVRSEHASHPMRPGAPVATLAGQLEIGRAVVDLLVDIDPDLERAGPDIRLAGFEVRITPEGEEDWERARAALRAGLDVPTQDELGMDPELVHLKTRAGELTRVGAEFVYLPEQLDEVVAILRSLPDDFTVADFRDASGVSRKYAVPLLEWADKEGLTIRWGDLRRLR